MSASKYALPLFLLVAALCGTSNAQSSLPPYQVSYCIEVQHEMWRNGATYWSTEYETSSLNEAQLVLGLFEAALENAISWICRAQDKSISQDGGVARHFSVLDGWGPSYPETTGYIIHLGLRTGHADAGSGASHRVTDEDVRYAVGIPPHEVAGF